MLRRLHEVVDRRLVFLPAEVGIPQERLRAFVVREQRDQLGVVLQHAQPDRPSIPTRAPRMMWRSPSLTFDDEAAAFVTASMNSLVVPDVFARPT